MKNSSAVHDIIENLKCCGNCALRGEGKFEDNYVDEWCNRTPEFVAFSHFICKHWQNDMLNKTERLLGKRKNERDDAY